MRTNKSNAALEYLLIVAAALLIIVVVTPIFFNTVVNQPSSVTNYSQVSTLTPGGGQSDGQKSQQEDQGTLVLSITDGKVPNLQELNIKIEKVEVHKDGQWISFEPNQKSFELLSLSDAADVIGSKKLTPGKYTQIRFDVVSADLKLADGTTSSVKIPSGEIKLVREFTVEAGKKTYLYIDFKPESVIKAGKQYILQPVIKVLALSEFKEDLCVSRSISCDDFNPCTADSCDSGSCFYKPVQDGTSCGTGLVCKAGQCISETQATCSKLNFTASDQKITFAESYMGFKGSSLLIDLDNDGDVDLVQGAISSDEEYPWLPGRFYKKAKVLFNDGKGNFTDSGQFLGKGTVWSAAGDIDNDGDNDVVTGSYGGTTMKAYFNNGKGTFVDSNQSLGGWIDFFPKLADFDGDGDLDLYSPIWPFHSPQSRLFLNDGKGIFSEYLQSGLNIPGWGVYSGYAVFDVDKDNDTDIVEVSWNGSTMNTRILKNNGKAQFTVSQDLIDVGGAVGAADFDRDGNMDFIASSLFKNDGKGNFTPQAPGTSYSSQQYYDPYYYLAVADIDKVNGKDFMLDYFPTAMLNKGDATFLQCSLPDLYKNNYDTKTYYSFFPYEIGDIDGDGDIDMVGPAYSGSYSWDSNLTLSVAINNMIK